MMNQLLKMLLGIAFRGFIYRKHRDKTKQNHSAGTSREGCSLQGEQATEEKNEKEGKN